MQLKFLHKTHLQINEVSETEKKPSELKINCTLTISLLRRKVRFLCTSSRLISCNKRNIYRIYVVGGIYMDG
jgi:hypothetical protein